MENTENDGQSSDDIRITLVGAGTIGLSFAALHLLHLKDASNLTVFDTRPDLESYVLSSLPKYLPEEHHDRVKHVRLAKDLAPAVENASVVQEQGPENLPFKARIWPEIENYAPPEALFWSSTSGIPASAQSRDMRDKTRLLVVHPYNPPHVMPLLELVPSPSTSDEVVRRTLAFWKSRGREPVVVKREMTGFVANRLAFALLRESIHLVNEGVVTVDELDRIVETSMGPRWAVAGPFKSYHAGGGTGGLEAFFANIGGTVQGCWDDIGQANVGDGWEDAVFRQTKEKYGVVNTGERDRITRRVLEVVAQEKEKR